MNAWCVYMFGYSRPQPQSLLVLILFVFKCNLCWNSQILSRCTSWPSLWNTCHTFTSLASMKSHSLLVYKHEKEGLLCPLSHICLWRATKHYSMNQARINQNQRGFNMESPEICRHSILPETTTMHLFLQRTAVRWKDFFFAFQEEPVSKQTAIKDFLLGVQPLIFLISVLYRWHTYNIVSKIVQMLFPVTETRTENASMNGWI